MAVTQYVGARYVPLFADPIEWDSQYAYEPLTIVLHEGNSYTSRQYVPKGVDISNDAFWAETGNYNAQVEQYREEVSGLSTALSALTTTVNGVISHFLTPEQFGAKGDGTTNDLQAFQRVSEIAKDNDNLTIVLKHDAEYYIDFPTDQNNFVALNFFGINNLEIIGNGAVVHVASNDNTKYFINIQACENVRIHDFTVYSEFDKPSQAFGDHTRDNAVGSNICPIVLTNNNVKNVAVYNMTFRYMSVCVNCISLPAFDTFSTGLHVFNCTSDYHAMFIFTNKYNNVTVNNCTLRGALRYGDGDHSFYFRGNIDTVTISNITATNDSYFGPDILFYPDNAGDTYNTVANISNYSCTGNAFISAYTGGNIRVNGFTFIQANESAHSSTTNYPVFGIRSNVLINATNGRVLNKNLVYGTAGELRVSNSYVLNSNYPIINLPKNATVVVKNSTLIGRAIILSTETGNPSTTAIIERCSMAISNTDVNYAIAARASNSTVKLINNSIDLNTCEYLFSNAASAAVCVVKCNDIFNATNTAKIGTLSSGSKQYGNYCNGAI